MNDEGLPWEVVQALAHQRLEGVVVVPDSEVALLVKIANGELTTDEAISLMLTALDLSTDVDS